MEEQENVENTVYKALERPALIAGLPLPLLFFVCAVPFLLGLYISKVFWIFIPILVFILGLFTKNDPCFYSILYLKLRTKGPLKLQRFLAADGIYAQKYDQGKVLSEVTSKRNNDESQD